jgi:hypothetical protein
MGREIYFRKILPPLSTIVAFVLGEWGLWLRSVIIRNSLAWDSTIRFHSWPWPFKFAAVLNLPAILAGLLLSWPLDALRPGFPELISFLSVLLFVPLLWYWVGTWLDQRIGGNMHGNARARRWLLLLVFGVVCAATSSIPPKVAGYTSYLPFGIVIWMTAVAGVTASTIVSRKHKSKAA